MSPTRGTRVLGNLANLVPTAASEAGNRVAMRLGQRTLSFAELDVASSAVGAALRARGVGPGDRVGLILPNAPEFAACYFGVLRIGAVVVPMNVQFKPREIAHVVRDSGAAIVLAGEDVATVAAQGAKLGGAPCEPVAPGSFTAGGPGAHDPVDREPDDTAVILYTSGTTGSPKGAALTHANVGRNTEVMRDLFGLTETDVVLGALPLFHSFGQVCGMVTALAARAEFSLMERFDAGQALDVLERDRVTVFQGVPTMYGALLSAAGPDSRLDALRLCVSGGASLPLELLRAFEERFGCVILEGYGLSETGPVAAFNRSAEMRRPGSVGQPIPGVEMRVVDDDGEQVPVGEVGEIVIRGHNIMKGYWDRPDATAEAMRGGWFHSGDLGRVDEDGFFSIVDRKKDMIIRGGYNVYPREIEEVLYEHPDVSEAAVFGVPDERLGEEVAAAVTLRAGATCSAGDLREHARELLAAYKYPRAIQILPELPKGPTGKILKRELRVSRDHG